jgi:hypothetical protein
MSLAPAVDTVSVKRVELRNLVIQLLLSPTTSGTICTSIEKFFPVVGLALIPAYSICYQDGKPEIYGKNIVVDATTNLPINEAVRLRKESSEEITAMLGSRGSRYEFLGATYFTNKSSTDAVRLNLLTLPKLIET